MKFVEPQWPADQQRPLDVQRLLLQAQLGDEGSFIELFAQYQPLIMRVWQKYYGAEIELADWKQEAFIILFRVVNTEELDDARFGGYYKQSLVHRIVNLCRKRQADKRIPQQSLAEIGEHLEEIISSPSDESVDDITHCHFCLQELIRSSSPFERQVLVSINSGQPAREVCQELNCSLRKVESAISRLRSKTLQILK